MPNFGWTREIIRGEQLWLIVQQYNQSVADLYLLFGSTLLQDTDQFPADVDQMLYRYCIFGPPLFSSFRCLLLAVLLGVSPSSLWPVRPAIPCFRLPKVLTASHTEYKGIAAHIHHAMSPEKITNEVVPQDQ